MWVKWEGKGQGEERKGAGVQEAVLPWEGRVGHGQGSSRVAWLMSARKLANEQGVMPAWRSSPGACLTEGDWL